MLQEFTIQYGSKKPDKVKIHMHLILWGDWVMREDSVKKRRER